MLEATRLHFHQVQRDRSPIVRGRSDISLYMPWHFHQLTEIISIALRSTTAASAAFWAQKNLKEGGPDDGSGKPPDQTWHEGLVVDFNGGDHVVFHAIDHYHESWTLPDDELCYHKPQAAGSHRKRVTQQMQRSLDMDG